MPRAPTGRDFYVATSEEIRDGRTTDVYFLRTLDILKKAGKDRTRVVAEVTAGTLPNGWPWGILCGVEEAVHLLAGKVVSLWSLPEGSLFPARTARGLRGGPQVPRGEGPADCPGRYVLRREDGGSPGRRSDPGPHGSATRHAGLPPRQLPRDCAGGPLGTGPSRPQGRADFRVRFRRREDDPGARRCGRRWIRRRHEAEQRADDRLRDGHRRGRGQTGGQAWQVRRPQGSAALPEGRDLRGRGADVRGGGVEDGPRLRPVSGQWSGLDAAPVARGHPAADGRRNLPCGPRNLTEPFIEPHRFVGATMDRSKASVRATYDRFAASYAAAPQRPWDEALDVIMYLPAGRQVLDVGCGHGRHARPLALTGQSVVGIDVSRKLLSIGKKATSSSQDFRSIEWVGADATALPFPDATFDAALSIAVLHHLPSRADRLLAVTEMRRVLRPGAKAFLSVWSVDDPYLEGVLGGRPKKPDVEIPWRLPDGTTVPRPYHLFKDDELERLIIESGLEGESFFRGAGNRFALARANG